MGAMRGSVSSVPSTPSVPRVALITLVAVAIAVPALGGCVGSGPGAGPAGDGTDGAPANGSGQDGTGPGGGASPDGAQIHEEATAWVRDRWGDAERIVLFEGIVQTGGVVTMPNVCIFCTSGFIEVPAGQVVLPGTASLEVAVAWQDPPTAPDVVVAFDHLARGGEWERATFAEPGNISIPVPANMTDAPFADVTVWRFDVDAHADPAGSNYEMDVDVTLAIRRAGELPAIPVPPDPWEGTDRVVLVDDVTRTQTYWDGFQLICISAPSCGTTWQPPAGPLVPPNASRVRAVLAWEWTVPSQPSLSVRVGGGDAQPMDLVEDGDGRRVFEVAVDPGSADSPFQRRSRWTFAAGLETQGQPRGAVVDGSMTLFAEAVRG